MSRVLHFDRIAVMDRVEDKYRIEHKMVSGHHVFTSPDVQGLYVAHRDRQVAYDSIPSAIEALRRVSERIAKRNQVRETVGARR